MEGTPRASSVEDKAKAAIEVLALTRLMRNTLRDLRATLAEPVLSEFIGLVGKNELVADIQSMERMTASLREEADRYLTDPFN